MRTSTRYSKLDLLESRPLQRPKPLVMGIVNATPDSFYAGSRGGVDHALRLLDEGADWLDVGGQSTRPGSDSVSVEEELKRVLPVIEAVSKKAVVSIDTDKPEVAARALDAGARILNDISALRHGCLSQAPKFDKVVLMHMLGDSPKTMQQNPVYESVVAEVSAFLTERVEAFVKAGGKRENAYIDPGIGFGKTLEHNLSLLKHLGTLAEQAPLVLGASRKSFLSKITPDAGPEQRLEGSLAAAVWGARAGAAVVRVHDVAATRRALDVFAAIEGAA